MALNSEVKYINEPLISVVMATFNGEKYINEQIDSILKQSYPKFELIIVDDHSTDNTVSIIDKYSNYDDRIRVYVSDINRGLVKNFERGLSYSIGDFIVLSDQDDIFHIDKLQLMIDCFKRSPNVSLVLSDLKVIDAKGLTISESFWNYQNLKPQSGKPFKRLVFNNFSTGCAMMFRRNLLDIALPFPDDIVVHDWWLALIASKQNSGGIELISSKLTFYRQHDQNMIGANPSFRVTLKLLSEFLLSPSTISNLMSTKVKDLEYHQDRLGAYLESGIWSSEERDVIINTRKMFQEIPKDKNLSILLRLKKLPHRVVVASRARQIKFILFMMLITLWPRRK